MTSIHTPLDPQDLKTLNKIVNKNNKQELKKANYNLNKEKILQKKREIYKQKKIEHDKLKRELEKILNNIPKDYLHCNRNTIKIKQTKYKVTYIIKYTK